EFKKGYFSLDGGLSFKEIRQRQFIYRKVDGTEEVKKVLEGISRKEAGAELKPIVKLKIKNASSIDLGVIEKSFRERAILVFQREARKDLSKKASEIVRKQMTAEELGMSLLKEKSKLPYADELLGLILDEDLEGAEKLLRVGFGKRGEEPENGGEPEKEAEKPKEAGNGEKAVEEGKTEAESET
ncbi:MAG: hypothetical protein ACP5E4_00685, partial [Candidatus Aenigmatarchaeota archaeon]